MIGDTCPSAHSFLFFYSFIIHLLVTRFALFDSISLFPSIIGLLVTSFVADSLGIGNIFIYCGFAIVLTAILMMCIPSVRNLEKEEIRKKK